MQIYWHGYSSVRLEIKQGEHNTVVMTDPYENESAMRFPRAIEPEILLLSHQDRSKFNVEGVAGKPFIISDPGEYEVGGVFVNGIQDGEQGEGAERPLVYRIEGEEMAVAYLGMINRSLTDKELEALGNVDILILPVGNAQTYNAKQVAATISLIEPRLVIPINFAVPGIKTELGTVDQFCNALGSSKRQDANRVKISKKELPVDDMLIMVLERT